MKLQTTPHLAHQGPAWRALRTLTGLSCAVLLSLGHTPMASAQGQSSQTPQTPPAAASSASPPSVSLVHKLPQADADFLHDAIQRCLTNAQSSQLALETSRDTQVKNLAQQIVTQHAKTRDQLVTLAMAKGVEVPTAPSLTQKAKLMMLSMRDGGSFDKDYISTWGISANEEAVDLFQKAAAEAGDNDVRALAKEALPALQHAVELARSLRLANTQSKAGD